MALPVHRQAQYWGLATLVFFVILYLLGDVILPFVLGGAIAYLLDPVADRLERMGLSRALATALITVVGILVFVLLTLLIIPTLVRQTTALIQAIPQILGNLEAWMTQRFPSMMSENGVVREQLAAIGELIRSRGNELLQGVLTSARGLLNIIVLIVIVPVVSVYLLLDWDRMVAEVDKLLPRDHAPVIRRLAKEIDDTLAGFLRGQGTVCLILGIYYAVLLMIVGLNYGLVVGFIAGLISFIPYVGAIVGGALAIGLALFQFWGEWWWIVAVYAIFQSGQMIEGNILTPKLVGDSVGLHPVWLIFALSVFGTLFGFVGMLVAVPVAAMLGVVARFAIEQYQQSRLYWGLSERETLDTAEADPDAAVPEPAEENA
ncbi:AI-2E family transporter [Aestuariibius sp. 2305UL40-4]|uniref:AI-2E family transporter n=1 Tax=Aestuariibius violaceus TaxID=3234132 RepID=UPI00345EA25B